MLQPTLPGLDPVPFQVAADPDYRKLCYIWLICPVCFPFPVKVKPDSSFLHGLVTSLRGGRKHYECPVCSFAYTMPDAKDAKEVWGEEITAKLNRQWRKEEHWYTPFSPPYYERIK